MRKYQILCCSLDMPNNWVFLGGSHHAMTYAATIYKDDHRCIQLFLQYVDFLRMLASVEGDEKRDKEKRAFLEFQSIHQSDCIQCFINLRKKTQMSEVKFPFAFVSSPGG